jgi:MFS transporter, DHA1 family, multidrug resistance protein
MGATTAVNLVLNHTLEAQVGWALWPIALFAMGWAVMTPVVTLLVLDVVPTRRGMASSLQACITSSVNGVVAGVVAPWVMHSTTDLALASASMLSVGLLSWWWVRPRL